MILTILGVVLGAIISILITIKIENLRQPKLELRLVNPVDLKFDDRPARNARFLLLELINKPIPTWASFISRNTALQCHGNITFHHLDKQNIFNRAMETRWSLSPNPMMIPLVIGRNKGFIYDSSRLITRIDIPPGEAQPVDVAARFDDDEECYGWNNESFFSDPQWRNPKWMLKPGRYLVSVTIISAGVKCSGLFRLINDVPRQDFRLEKSLQIDTMKEFTSF